MNLGEQYLDSTGDRALAAQELAVAALAQATAADAMLAFSDAVAGFVHSPSWHNARNIEMTMLALRHHRHRCLSLPGDAVPVSRERGIF